MLLRTTTITIIAALLVTVGCTGDEPDTVDRHYALQRDPDWNLQEAVDPPPNDRLAARDRPPMDWYAEYISGSVMVRLSGHAASPVQARRALGSVGFEFDAIELPRHGPAHVGTAPSDESGPTVLVMAGHDNTLLLLSYEADAADLVDFAATVSTATPEEWRAHGGISCKTLDVQCATTTTATNG